MARAKFPGHSLGGEKHRKVGSAEEPYQTSAGREAQVVDESRTPKCVHLWGFLHRYSQVALGKLRFAGQRKGRHMFCLFWDDFRHSTNAEGSSYNPYLA